ncbi:rCG54129 [Rattus norvegicus]|uniref:RCG54129 n=1 Tax=Rattus norvegicus TaxID=10116 RepID=A6J8B0_RAT|nr:rCG54129 [Rattus norvegicus]
MISSSLKARDSELGVGVRVLVSIFSSASCCDPIGRLLPIS